MFTYGDGVSNVNLRDLEKFHIKNKKNYHRDRCKTSCKIWRNNDKKQSSEYF